MNEVKIIQQSNIKKEENVLQFTGNWFIDAGILGFINLMEEVYGWDLDKLKYMLKEKPEIVYYGYFPIAYIHYNKNQSNPFLENKDLPIFTSTSKEKIFEDAWGFIEKQYKAKNKERIDLRCSGNFRMFTNFLFFQPRWNKEKQKDSFMQILGLKNIQHDVLKDIDKTINKFLPSVEEFTNLFYTKSFITLETLLVFHPHSFVFILSFPLAFQNVSPRNQEGVFFYSPDLEFTYKISRKFSIFLKRLGDKSKLIRITWKIVIDSAIETQSLWTLENMYLISYQLDNKQNFTRVEYVGIPKIQANIIIDETIRENLNKSVQLRENKCWLLEEFLKGRSLYPIVLNYINEVLNLRNYKGLNYYSMFYSLIVDSKILEFRESKKRINATLFSERYFDNYKALVDEIKKEVKLTYFKASLIGEISKDKEHKERVARELLNALKGEDKNIFLNILLKNLNEERPLCRNNNFNNWILEKIISNNISWKNYGLILVINLLKN
jgi:CRISPR-associated protein Cst1